MAKQSKPSLRATAKRVKTAEALAPWFRTPLTELPADMRAIVEQIAPGPALWDCLATDPRGALAEERRRAMAQWHDLQHDPEAERIQGAGMISGFRSVTWQGLLAAVDDRVDTSSARRWLAWRRMHADALRKLVKRELRREQQRQLAAIRDRKPHAARSGALVLGLTKPELACFVLNYRSEHRSDRGIWKAAARRFQVSEDTIARRRREWDVE